MMALQSSAADIVNLTEEQQAIVDSIEPALVVTAPAGTGKTEVLVRRAERFVRDQSNGYARVLVVTYTTRAAEEFASRLRRPLGSAMERVTAETLHGFAQSLLSTHGSHVGLPPDFGIITTDEDRAELFAGYDASWQSGEGLDLFRELDLARAKGLAHPRLSAWSDALAYRGAVDFNEMIAKATELLHIGAVADMLRNVYGLVLVDEAQNLTQQQYEFLVALIGRRPDSRAPHIPTTLLGDPNQLVTGFAGGDSSHMESFKADFCAEKATLLKNFRSSLRLSCLESVVAGALGRSVRGRRGGAGEVATGVLEVHHFKDEGAEGEFIAEWADELLTEGLPAEAVMASESRRVLPEQIAVLGRHAAALSAASDALVDRGHAVARAHNVDDYMSSRLGKVAFLLMRYRSDRHRLAASGELRRDFGIEFPAELMGESGAVPSEADETLRRAAVVGVEALAPLLTVVSPSEFVEALDTCRMAKSEGSDMLASWSADRALLGDTWAEFADVTPVRERSWTAFGLHVDRETRGRDLGSGVRVLTVHKAQGREFKAAAVAAMNDGQFPDFRATSAEAERAELQTFYVAATRASRVLLLTRAGVRPTRYGDRTTEPSRFLQLVQRARIDSELF